MARSRLAIPFLRPLLPLESCTNAIAGEEKEDDKGPVDLVYILEKIHSCEYTSVKAFQKDLNTLRNQAIEKMEDALKHCVDETEDVHQLSTYKDLLISLDTIMEAAEQFLDSKVLILQTIEDEVAGKLNIQRHISEHHNGNSIPEEDVEHVATTQQPPRRGRRRASDTSSNSNDTNGQDSGHKVSGYIAEGFWRVECEFDPSLFKSMKLDSVTLKVFNVFEKTAFHRKPLIASRTIQQWAEHVRQGYVPQQYKEGVLNGMNKSAYRGTPRSVASYQGKNDVLTKLKVRQLLDQETLDAALVRFVMSCIEIFSNF